MDKNNIQYIVLDISVLLNIAPNNQVVYDKSLLSIETQCET